MEFLTEGGEYVWEESYHSPSPIIHNASYIDIIPYAHSP